MTLPTLRDIGLGKVLMGVPDVADLAAAEEGGLRLAADRREGRDQRHQLGDVVALAAVSDTASWIPRGFHGLSEHHALLLSPFPRQALPDMADHDSNRT